VTLTPLLLLLQVVAKFGPELSINVLEAMPYADAVVREVLRVAPPSAQVTRQTLVDMEVRGNRKLT
jgi:cytochrome P450